MSDPVYGFPKPQPRCVLKKKAEKLDDQAERVCRIAVNARDKRKCRIPGCKEYGAELHHVVPRSQSKRKRWLTSNCLLLCLDHHRLRHAGVIQITGNADEEIIVTGDVNRLRFRL
jgi:hypothetical protein